VALSLFALPQEASDYGISLIFPHGPAPVLYRKPLVLSLLGSC